MFLILGFSLYPVTAQPIYLLHAPHFKAANIRLLTPLANDPSAKQVTLEIRARKSNSVILSPRKDTLLTLFRSVS
jgi:putative alpha-1,2-mannosidase